MKRILPTLVGLVITVWLGFAATDTPAQIRVPAFAVAIVTPTMEQTIHSNEGELLVEIQTTPPLARELGARWVVRIDGREHAVVPADGEPIRLEGIERGEHVLSVELQDAKGQRLAGSESVTFHMWQASRLFPTQKPKLAPSR